MASRNLGVNYCQSWTMEAKNAKVTKRWEINGNYLIFQTSVWTLGWSSSVRYWDDSVRMFGGGIMAQIAGFYGKERPHWGVPRWSLQLGSFASEAHDHLKLGYLGECWGYIGYTPYYTPEIPQRNAPDNCPYTRRPSSRPKTIMTCKSRSFGQIKRISNVLWTKWKFISCWVKALHYKISDATIRRVHPGGHRPKEWHFHSSLPKELLASEQRLSTDEHLSPHLSRKLYRPLALEKQGEKM